MKPHEKLSRLRADIVSTEISALLEQAALRAGESFDASGDDKVRLAALDILAAAGRIAEIVQDEVSDNRFIEHARASVEAILAKAVQGEKNA